MVLYTGPQGLRGAVLMAIALVLASCFANASVQVLYTTDTNPNLLDRMEQGQAYVVGFATGGGCPRRRCRLVPCPLLPLHANCLLTDCHLYLLQRSASRQPQPTARW